MSQEVEYTEFEKRYRSLERKWFESSRREVDRDTGEELPTVVDRAALAKMFENMGCDIPISPGAPIRFIQRA